MLTDGLRGSPLRVVLATMPRGGCAAGVWLLIDRPAISPVVPTPRSAGGCLPGYQRRSYCCRWYRRGVPPPPVAAAAAGRAAAAGATPPPARRRVCSPADGGRRLTRATGGRSVRSAVGTFSQPADRPSCPASGLASPGAGQSGRDWRRRGGRGRRRRGKALVDLHDDVAKLLGCRQPAQRVDGHVERLSAGGRRLTDAPGRQVEILAGESHWPRRRR